MNLSLRGMTSVLHTVLLLLVALSSGQYNSNNGTQNVCAYLNEEANATGGQLPRRVLSNLLGEWKVSVRTNFSTESIQSAESTASANNSDAVANVWLDPFEGLDLNDGDNSFSACAFIAKTLPENTNRRGQNDDGGCEQMFSKKCVDKLTAQAAHAAQWLVQNPTIGPFSNLTPPILGPICSQINGAIAGEDSMPPECRPYFYRGDTQNLPDPDVEYSTFNLMPLTDNVTKPINCSFYANGPQSHTVLWTDWNSPPGTRFPYNGTSPVEAYDTLVQQVWPILTVIFPPANNTRTSSIGNADAQMTCLRANNIKQGSRTPSPLPEAHAVKFPRSSAWYGIRVGIPLALVGAALLAAVAWCIWRRKRNGKKNVDASKSDAMGTEGTYKDGTPVHQLENTQTPSQLPADHKVKMSAGHVPRTAKGNDGNPQEMLGSIPALQADSSTTLGSGRQEGIKGAG